MWILFLSVPDEAKEAGSLESPPASPKAPSPPPEKVVDIVKPPIPEPTAQP